MKPNHNRLRRPMLLLAASTFLVGSIQITAADETPSILVTPDKVETRIGTLEFKDGAPSADTVDKVYDTLDFTRGLDAFLNSYGGASAYAIRKGLLGIGAEDNTVTIYPELMDSKSLFLTANADTVYYFSIVDLTKGPMVIEQPPKGVGTINDMWFQWVIDIGFPGPDRGEGGRYLILPPGYDGPLPDSGFHVARSKTNRVIYASRGYLENNDPKPAVENIKKTMKIYPYTPGGFGTSIATALEGKVKLGANPPVPETKFVEASGKSFNTIPPSDYSFFEMINANVQDEPAELLQSGTCRTIGRHRHREGQGVQAGRPDEEDTHRRGRGRQRCRTLAELALQWASSRLGLLPRTRCGATCCGRVVPISRRRRRGSARKACSSRCRRPAPGPSIPKLRSTTATHSTRLA